MPWFREEATARGLAFQYVSGHGARYLFPEIMGGGVALFDAEGDGDLDAYLVQGGSIERSGANPPNQLFLNDGGGRFQDATAASGAGDRGYGMGVACGDADGDGLADLYVTNLGPNAFLRNLGGARFADLTLEARVGDPGWGTSATFFDGDLDGDLDLFLVNYIRWSPDGEIDCERPPLGRDYCGPKAYSAPVPCVLYRNDGGAAFTDVSESAGMRSAFGNGLGVVVFDHDFDGLPDVFVANDGVPNQLWRNLGELRFQDRAVQVGCAFDMDGVTKAGMGVACLDFDDDEDEDLLVVNLHGESDSFYRNDRSILKPQSSRVGLALASRGYTRFGCGFVDFDNDGWDDLYVANGRVERSTAPVAADPYAEPNLLYRGTADARFERVDANGGVVIPLVHTSRGAAFGDVDGDGGVDVVVVNRDAPSYLLMNQVHGAGHWLHVTLRDPRGSAVGARVMLDVGDRRITRVLRSGYSYCAASELAVHVGLGERTEARARVRWSDGTEEDFGAQPADRRVGLVRGTAR